MFHEILAKKLRAKGVFKPSISPIAMTAQSLGEGAVSSPGGVDCVMEDKEDEVMMMKVVTSDELAQQRYEVALEVGDIIDLTAD